MNKQPKKRTQMQRHALVRYKHWRERRLVSVPPPHVRHKRGKRKTPGNLVLPG